MGDKAAPLIQPPLSARKIALRRRTTGNSGPDRIKLDKRRDQLTKENAQLRDDSYTNLVDQIYEAALIADVWPDVLAKLTDVGDGAFASLFVLKDGDDLRWVGTPAADLLMSDYVSLDQPELNTRIPRWLRNMALGFITDLEIFTECEIANEPFYRDFLHPRGYGWVAATGVLMPSGEIVSVSVK
jgi:hypothetical protein